MQHGSGGATASRVHRERRGDIDNLKVTLVAGVILTHAVLTYADAGDWFYQEKNLGELVTLVVFLPGLVGALFAMGLFFLVAGWFSPPALERKGPWRFSQDRLLRLGLPLVAFMVLVTPFVNELVAYQTEDLHRPVLPFYRHLIGHLDTGPLWFLAVLLLFSLGYAAIRAIHPRSAHTRPPGEEESSGGLRAWHLVVLGVVIAVTSFLVRLEFAMDSKQVMNLHVFQWPQHLALFAFGVLCGERGWLDPVPDRLRRGCGWVALAAMAALPVVMALGGAFAEDGSPDAFSGGVHWESLATSVIEGALAVGASIWFLAWFRRRWSHQGPLARELARAAYGAFILQTPVLVLVALALRPLSMTPELKLLVLAPVAVMASFGLSWLAGEAVARLTGRAHAPSGAGRAPTRAS